MKFHNSDNITKLNEIKKKMAQTFDSNTGQYTAVDSSSMQELMQSMEDISWNLNQIVGASGSGEFREFGIFGIVAASAMEDDTNFLDQEFIKDYYALIEDMDRFIKTFSPKLQAFHDKSQAKLGELLDEEQRRKQDLDI